MNRICRFILIVAICTSSHIGWFSSSASAQEAGPGNTASKPNVILIFVDALRQDHLGCYGYRAVKTPNIDALAQESFLFTQAITTASVTPVVFSSLMTGLYPFIHGVRTLSHGLDSRHTTLAEILKDYGYRTCAIVGSDALSRLINIDQGFDEYNDRFEPQKLSDPSLYKFNLDIFRRAERVSGLAVDWLKRNKDSRFFLWLHYWDPHTPYDAPEPFRAMYDPDYQGPIRGTVEDYLRTGLTPDDYYHMIALYDGEVAYVDEQIGVLLRALRELGLFENSLIIFAADHGEGFEGGNRFGHGGHLYQSALKVPLLIKLPAGRKAKAGSIDSLVSSMDIFPTVLDIVNIRKPKNLSALSLLPLMEGKVETLHPFVYSETLNRTLWGNKYVSLVTPRWKLIKPAVLDDEEEPQLYDLKKDPDELNNLAEMRKDILRALLKELEDLFSTRKRRFKSERIGDEELKEKLRSLGYVQ